MCLYRRSGGSEIRVARCLRLRVDLWMLCACVGLCVWMLCWICHLIQLILDQSTIFVKWRSNYFRRGSATSGWYPSSTSNAFCLTLAGSLFNCNAWNPAHPNRVWCAEQNLRRFLARFCSPVFGEGVRAEDLLLEWIREDVCWHMALWDGQWRFWHSGEQYYKFYFN